MAGRPARLSPPSSQAVREAIEGILGRRRAAEDPALEQLGDDPVSVVAHVLAQRRVPVAVLRHDVVASLLLVRHLRSELDRQELDLIKAARSTGLEWAELAEPLGVRTKQAAEQRALRLQASWETRTEQRRLQLVDPQAAGSAVRRPETVRNRRRGETHVERWLNRNELAVDTAAGGLLRRRSGLPRDGDLDEELDELERALSLPRAGTRQREVLIARLGLVLDSLGGVAAEQGWRPLEDEVSRVVARARMLSTDYRAVKRAAEGQGTRR